MKIFGAAAATRRFDCVRVFDAVCDDDMEGGGILLHAVVRTIHIYIDCVPHDIFELIKKWI